MAHSTTESPSPAVSPVTTPSSAVPPQQPRAAPQPTAAAAMPPAPMAYAPYPYAQAPYAPVMMVPFSKTWHWTKIGLMSASLVFSIIALGLSIALAVGGDYETAVSLSITWVGPLVVVAALWDIAEFITLCACGRRHGTPVSQGIHPGAHVGVDLLLWLFAILCTLASGVSVRSAESEMQYCEAEEEERSRYYYYYDYCDSYDTLRGGFYIPAMRAVTAFLALLTIVHFVIFVRACVETSQRNRARPRVVVVPPQMYYGPPAGAPPASYYPMMPPQAHMAVPQAARSGEKPQEPQASDPNNLAGFYAPAVANPTPQQPQAPAGTAH